MPGKMGFLEGLFPTPILDQWVCLVVITVSCQGPENKLGICPAQRAPVERTTSISVAIPSS